MCTENMSVVLFKFKVSFFIYCLFSSVFCTSYDTKDLLLDKNNRGQSGEVNKSHPSLVQITPPPSYKFDENSSLPKSNNKTGNFSRSTNKSKEPEHVTNNNTQPKKILPEVPNSDVNSSTKNITSTPKTHLPPVINNSSKFPEQINDPKKVQAVGNVQQTTQSPGLTKNQDQVALPVSEKKSDSESKQPLLKDSNNKNKSHLDRSEKKNDQNILTDQDEENSKKVEEEKKNSKFNPSFDDVKNDQVVISNDENYYKDVHPAKTLFPDKNAILYDDTNSHFFAYFLTLMVMAVLFYLLFHNKHRIIALLIEGRRGPPSRRGVTRAKYHKLDNNLEEAMNSTRGAGIDGGTNGALGNIY